MSVLRTHLSSGKTVRLSRIFGADHRAVIVAFDHGVTGVNTLGALADPAALIREIAPHADSVLVSAGILRAYADAFGRTGIVARLDGGPTSVTGKYDRIRPMLSVEDALRLGADGVVMMGLIGTRREDESLREVSRVAADCDRLGVPLVVEMLPGGLTAENASLEALGVAARVGAELGADIVKIAYRGPAASFRRVTSDCFRPVVVLGGAKREDGDFITGVVEAMHAGVAGVAIGRNVWRDPRPGNVVRRLREVVHGPDAT